jgi:hypothetical protein
VQIAEEIEDENDRKRNPDQPKDETTTHINFSCSSVVT